MSADSDGGAVGTIEPLAVISSMATRSLLADIARVYADRAGVELRIESVGGVDAAKRIRAGEKVDVVVLASGAMTTLAADGFVRPTAWSTWHVPRWPQRFRQADRGRA